MVTKTVNTHMNPERPPNSFTFFPSAHTHRFLKPFLFMNVLYESVEIINFIKSQPLSTHLFNMLCD
jgi:hypothetical protein